MNANAKDEEEEYILPRASSPPSDKSPKCQKAEEEEAEDQTPSVQGQYKEETDSLEDNDLDSENANDEGWAEYCSLLSHFHCHSYCDFPYHSLSRASSSSSW